MTEMALFLQAASADASVNEIILYLREYFEITTEFLDGEERYKLQGWAGSRPVTELVPIKRAPEGTSIGDGPLQIVRKNTDAAQRSA